MEIDNSSFNNQLRSTIHHIDLFYSSFESKYNTNGSGKMNFIRPYIAGSSVFRKDILEDSKKILDILRCNPPIDSEELKTFFNDKKNELQSKDYQHGSQESSLVKLIKNIVCNLETINSHELNDNMGATFGK